jgi:hypothetical protein
VSAHAQILAAAASDGSSLVVELPAQALANLCPWHLRLELGLVLAQASLREIKPIDN